MGGHRWTTDEQLAWLQTKVPGYRSAQHRADVANYLTTVYTEWFKEWSEQEKLFPGSGVRQLTESETAALNAAMSKRRDVSNNIPSPEYKTLTI